MSWFYWAVSAAFLLALVNIADQLLLRRFVKSVSLATKILAFFSLLIIVAMLFGGWAKLGFSSAAMQWAIMAGILEIFYIYYYLKAIETEEVSFIVPIFSLAPIVTAIIAWGIWGETISTFASAGIIITIVGVTLLVIARYGHVAWRGNSALAHIVFSTFISALYALVISRGVAGADLWSALFWSRVGVAAGAVIITIGTRSWGDFTQFGRRAPYMFFISEILYGAGVLVSMKALAIGSASYVLGVENIQPIFVFIISYLLAKFVSGAIFAKDEFQRPALAWVSVLIVVAGAVLIQF